MFALSGFMTYGDTITYAYDNAGNRIKREITLERNIPTEKRLKPEIFSDVVSEKNINISPNPTSGIIKVEIVGYEDSDKCEVSIYSVSGLQMLAKRVSSSTTELDITSCAAGLYILQIRLNDNNTSWKIIKK